MLSAEVSEYKRDIVYFNMTRMSSCTNLHTTPKKQYLRRGGPEARFGFLSHKGTKIVSTTPNLVTSSDPRVHRVPKHVS